MEKVLSEDSPFLAVSDTTLTACGMLVSRNQMFIGVPPWEYGE